MVALTVTEHREKGEGISSEASIGLAYAACLATARVTLNPSAALGLAFLTNNYKNHWVLWVGPVIGGVAAAFCHLVMSGELEICKVNKQFEEVSDYRKDLYNTALEIVRESPVSM